MSCGTSCGTSSSCCETKDKEATVEELIKDAQLNWSVPLDEEDADKWDIIFHVFIYYN